MINPIETIYKGIRFRSRLEARWAVFLNALGFKFVYEPDTYNLDGSWYLPDFWVPEWKTFLEIKPEHPTQEQMEKCQSLSNLTDNEVLLIAGQPWIEEYKLFLFKSENTNQLRWDEEDPEDDDYSVPMEFAQDRKDERVIWLWKEEYGGTCLYVPPDPYPRLGDKDPLTGERASNIVKAFEKARQERFGT